jgi:hypothetical protein
LKQLYEASNLLEANLLKGMLQAEGFEILLSGEALTGGAGELPISVQQVWLWIDENAYTAARARLEQYENGSGVDWLCCHCGEANNSNFELCWHCCQPQAE